VSKKSFIDSVEVKTPCPEEWDEMTGTNRVRFCSHCSKDVNNLSEMTRKEAMRLVRATGGRMCIRYVTNPVTNRPLFADQIIPLTRRRSGLAAGVMTASLSLATLAYPQSDPVLPIVPQPVATVPLGDDDTAASERLTAIKGRIADHSGRPLKGVSILITDSDGANGEQLESDEHGVFSFTDLEAGTYQIRVISSSGIAKKAAAPITIKEGQIVMQEIYVRTVFHNPTGEVAGIGTSYGYGSGGAIAFVEYQHALSKAIANEDVNEVRTLLERGADANGKEPNYSNITPLFLAVESGKTDLVSLLLQYGAKANFPDAVGRTPLMFIDDDASRELVQLLIQAGARVDAIDETGETPLFAGVRSGKVDVVQALVESSARLEATDENGLTPLMLAVDRNDLEMVKGLIVAGADVNAMDKEAQSVWDRTSNPEIEKALVDAGATASYDVEVEIDHPDEEEPDEDDDTEMGEAEAPRTPSETLVDSPILRRGHKRPGSGTG
jgi:hypothetical protein